MSVGTQPATFCHTFRMAGFGGLGSRCGSVVRGKIFLLFCVGLAAGLDGAALAAQDEAIPTLHVYANLIQIPVVVLSPFHMPLAPIAPSRFSISLDSGPQFRPTHVRTEGDDPISLSILLDARGLRTTCCRRSMLRSRTLLRSRCRRGTMSRFMRWIVLLSRP